MNPTKQWLDATQNWDRKGLPSQNATSAANMLSVRRKRANKDGENGGTTKKRPKTRGGTGGQRKRVQSMKSMEELNQEQEDEKVALELAGVPRVVPGITGGNWESGNFF